MKNEMSTQKPGDDTAIIFENVNLEAMEADMAAGVSFSQISNINDETTTEVIRLDGDETMMKRLPDDSVILRIEDDFSIDIE